MKFTFLTLCFALGFPAMTAGQVVSPHAVDIPPWFAESFLDLRADVRDAVRAGKRLMIYLGQDARWVASWRLPRSK